MYPLKLDIVRTDTTTCSRNCVISSFINIQYENIMYISLLMQSLLLPPKACKTWGKKTLLSVILICLV